MIQGIIFDMDGVLIDSSRIHEKAYELVFQDFNRDFSYDKYAGKRTYDVFSEVLSDLDLEHSEIVKLSHRKTQAALQILETDGTLLPGVYECLKKLHTRFSLALGTSASRPTQELVFKKFELNRFFPIAINANDVRLAKPDPEIFLSCAQRMKLEPQNILVVEDSLAGAQAASAGGFFFVGIHQKTNDFRNLSGYLNDFNHFETLTDWILHQWATDQH